MPTNPRKRTGESPEEPRHGEHPHQDGGDLIWLSFTPQTGREQAGRRPALVISLATYNRKAGLALICPTTSKTKGYPFAVLLPDQGAMQGVVLADQLRSLDWQARQTKRIERLRPMSRTRPSSSSKPS